MRCKENTNNKNVSVKPQPFHRLGYHAMDYQRKRKRTRTEAEVLAQPSGINSVSRESRVSWLDSRVMSRVWIQSMDSSWQMSLTHESSWVFKELLLVSLDSTRLMWHTRYQTASRNFMAHVTQAVSLWINGYWCWSDTRIANSEEISIEKMVSV